VTHSLGMIQSLLRRLSYKPGCQFEVDLSEHDCARLSLTRRGLPSAAHDGAEFNLTIFESVQLSDIRTPADALQAVARLVARFELHEAAEFLQLDGHSVFLPHRPGAEFDGLSWSDFSNLSGRYLRALSEQLEPRR